MAFGQFSAHLIAPRVIRVVLYSDKYQYEQTRVTIYDDNDKLVPFSSKSKVVQYKVTAFELTLEQPFVLGQNYKVYLQNFGQVPLNVSEATTFPNFDTDYYYTGPLGAEYTKEQTTFRLWAPLASRVILKYEVPGEKHFLYRKLKRGERGVYEYTLEGDHEGIRYTYLVLNNGLEEEVTDPYALSSGPNGAFSYVINQNKYDDMNMHDDKLPPFTKPTEAIIYETSVRDQTIDERTDIEYPATFYGMIEEGRKVKDTYPAGFDYLKDLGFTHLQLMPVYDFKTVDETRKWQSYNWGYDPQQYFVLEGSYARDPLHPYNRISDFKLMVSRYHEVGIRIIMDVVFNHVYDHETSVFEKIVPNYYFRKTSEGVISNGSGCGNDLATERPMVRRLVVDACRYYAEKLGVDGFRFDLMGLIDIKTMEEVTKAVRQVKPDFLILGEGWEMMTPHPKEKLAHHGNASKTPEIGFFNDAFREIVKGGSFADNLHERGYMLGATNYRLGFYYAYAGSVLNTTFTPRYLNAGQSINYVECHDNGVLVDKMTVSNASECKETHLARLLSMNTIVMLSFGVPFFHRGQEIGVSKYGDLNSYKSSDKVNQFPYTLALKRKEMVEYFKALTALRKDCKFLHETDPKVIKNIIEFKDLPGGASQIMYNPDMDLSPYSHFNVYVNPTSEPVFISLEKPLKTILSSGGYIAARSKEYFERTMVAPYSVIVLGLRKGDSGPK